MGFLFFQVKAVKAPPNISPTILNDEFYIASYEFHIAGYEYYIASYEFHIAK